MTPTSQLEMDKVEKPVTDMVAKVNALVINSTEARLTVGAILTAIKGLQKEVDEAYDDIIKDAHATWKGALSKKAKYYDPLKQAEALAKSKALAYDEEIARKAREEQARLAAAAKAEEDRKRRELEERARKAEEAARAEREAKEKAEAEAKVAQEAQRRAEEAARAAKNARERAIAAKAEAEARERAEAARREAAEAEARAAKQDAKNEALKQKAEEVFVPVPVVETQAVIIEGQKTSTLHDAEIVDMQTFIKGQAASGCQFVSLIMPNTKALKQMATATKGILSIPGVRFFTTKTMSAKA